MKAPADHRPDPRIRDLVTIMRNKMRQSKPKGNAKDIRRLN